MIVEFIGGSMDGLQKKIERFYEYINADNEIYYAHVTKYEKLGWIYVWYQFQGNLSEQMVN